LCGKMAKGGKGQAFELPTRGGRGEKKVPNSEEPPLRCRKKKQAPVGKDTKKICQKTKEKNAPEWC